MIKKTYLILVFFLKNLLLFSGLFKFVSNFDKIRNSHFFSLLFIHDLEFLIKNDIIWINYKAQNFLKNILNREMCILEYGSGSSTIWFSKRVKNILSIEHNKNYFLLLKKFINKSCNIVLVLKEPKDDLDNFSSFRVKNKSFKDYVKYPNGKKKFDIIFIDGRCRNMCLKNSLNLIKDGGYIILDNSERKEYKSTINSIPLEKKHFVDWCPAIPFKTRTTFFFKK